MAVVKQRAYITIHDKTSTMSDLINLLVDPLPIVPTKSHGLGILQPTVCKTTEALNGTYELYLEHPIIEDDPRANHIKVDNIIRADGQYFRIRKVNKKLSKNGDKIITANAQHIWYDLGDWFVEDYKADYYAAYWFIKGIFDNEYAETDIHDQMPIYRFEWETNCGTGDVVGDPYGYGQFKNTNPVACLIGTENAFVSVFQKEINGEIRTPELYRNNFYFRLDWRKHDAVDNAFNIIHKIDMTDITENIDISNLITRLIVKDNYGHAETFTIDTDAIIAAGGWLPAHHRTKAVEFQYNNSENNDRIIDRFKQDARRYFEQVSTVKLSYKCNYAELSNTDLYKDYIAAKHCNVGDTGTIVCEALGITATNMEVVRKEKDVLKNETISLEFGTKSASLTDPKFMSQTVNNSKFNYSEVLPIGDVPNS